MQLASRCAVINLKTSKTKISIKCLYFSKFLVHKFLIELPDNLKGYKQCARICLFCNHSVSTVFSLFEICSSWVFRKLVQFTNYYCITHFNHSGLNSKKLI